MDSIAVCAVAILCVIASLCVRTLKPEFSPLLRLAFFSSSFSVIISES